MRWRGENGEGVHRCKKPVQPDVYARYGGMVKAYVRMIQYPSDIKLMFIQVAIWHVLYAASECLFVFELFHSCALSLDTPYAGHFDATPTEYLRVYRSTILFYFICPYSIRHCRALISRDFSRGTPVENHLRILLDRASTDEDFSGDKISLEISSMQKSKILWSENSKWSCNIL